MKKTKGILLSSILALGLSTSAFAGEGSSGAFVGIHTGATMMKLTIYPATLFPTNSFETVFNVGVKAGYQHFFYPDSYQSFHPVVGLRGYVNYDFNMQRSLFIDLQSASPVVFFHAA